MNAGGDDFFSRPGSSSDFSHGGQSDYMYSMPPREKAWVIVGDEARDRAREQSKCGLNGLAID